MGRRRLVFVVALSLLLPAIGVLLFSAGGRDDVYITLWEADRLAGQGELLNYNGERVEQSSSLLHVVVLAALTLLTPLSTVMAAYVLGLVAGASAVALAWRLAERISPGSGWGAALLAATSTYLAYWSTSGLETPLAAAALAGVALTGGRYLAAGKGLAVAVAAVAAAVLVRPEGALVVLAALVVPAVAFTRRRVGVLAVAAGGALALVSMWRLSYFGVPFPQPVMAKVGGLAIGDGLAYLLAWGAPLAAMAGLAAVATRRAWSPPTALAAGLVVAQIGFAVTSGGDWMEGGRMLVPAIPLLAALAAPVVVALAPVALVAVVGVQLLGLAWFAGLESTGRPVWAPAAMVPGWPWVERTNRVHLRDITFLPHLVAVVETLAASMERPVRVASGQGGMVAYYLFNQVEDARFTDVQGLTVRYPATCRSQLLDPTTYGRELPYDALLSAGGKCGPPPDVIFGLRRKAPASGYSVVHRQVGLTERPFWLIPGTPVKLLQIIAVKDEFLPLLSRCLARDATGHHPQVRTACPASDR